MDAVSYTRLAALLGAGTCMGLGAIGAAFGEGYTARSASEAIARQPAASGELLRAMLVGQAVAESASIFALVVAILLLFTDWPGSTPLEACALFSGGLCMGVGALGPGAGAGFPAAATCAGVARHPRAAGKLTMTMLVGQAVAQTPSVFALLVAFVLLFRDYSQIAFTLSRAAALLGAGIATGVGAVGPGIGAGFTAGSACDATSRRPERHPLLLRTMLIGQAVSQSTSIYALIVSTVLLLLV